MLKNYFKTALRQLWKFKLFSLVNIFGLATSMSVCLALILIVMDQYGYDDFHTKRNRIYRVISQTQPKNVPLKKADFATTALSVGDPLKAEYPFVESATRMVQISGSGWRRPDDALVNLGFGFAVDETFLGIFDFGWAAGDQLTSLQDPFTIVLAEKQAQELFPDSDPIGQSLWFRDLGEFTVTGIIPDPPKRSHIQYHFLMSFATVLALPEVDRRKIHVYDMDDMWRGLVYVLLKDRTDRSKLDNALNTLAIQYSDRHKENHFLLTSQALTNVLPSDNLSNEIGVGTPKIVLQFLITLGLIIILSACFNYTNLSIARSLKRAKEIGIRKVTGAFKKDIILQFLGEAIMIALLALVVAMGLLEYLIPALYGLDPFVEEVFDLKKTTSAYILFFLFSLMVGLLAGLFPAFNIAAFQPLVAIKFLTQVKVFSRVGIRKALIVVQFALSLIFILTVIIVLKQQEHVLNTELGSNTENVLNVRMDSIDYPLFVQQALQIKGVDGISGSQRVILTGENGGGVALFDEANDSMNLQYNTVTAEYINNVGLTLLAGEGFEGVPKKPIEQRIIINEKAMARMGFKQPQQAIGQEIVLNDLSLEIIGVVKDFHHDNIWFSPIQPYALFFGTDAFRNANILINPQTTQETITALHSLWSNMVPQVEMESFFTSERIYYMAKFFKMGSKIIGFVGILTLIIACLGLLGMVIYTVEGRTKEVGIRKVLGASIKSIVWELSKGFFGLLLIAIVLAIPIVLFGGNLWLQNFYLRISIGPWILFTGITMLALVGFLTVISQTYLAASQNPVGALRNE